MLYCFLGCLIVCPREDPKNCQGLIHLLNVIIQAPLDTSTAHAFNVMVLARKYQVRQGKTKHSDHSTLACVHTYAQTQYGCWHV